MAERGARAAPSPASKTPAQWLETAIKAREVGSMAEAAAALDRVLEAAPKHPIPLRLRAKVALERGEGDALSRFDAALRVDPGNADLHLGKAQALEIAGDVRGARIVTQQIAQQAPGFVPALVVLSSLRLAAGEEDFTHGFAEAAKRAPQDPNILAAWCDAYAGIDRFAEAATVAAKARESFPGEPHFALLEAINAGSAGDWEWADKLFGALETQSVQRLCAETRHRLRSGDMEAAQGLLDKALRQAPRDVAAWALQGLVWRLSESDHAKERAHWLHEQAGLVQTRELLAPDGRLDRARARLAQLHASTSMPLAQSLRGGSQTRGILFHSAEPVLQELQQAIIATLEAYREDLPEADPDHPLLSERDTAWRLAGSWSVRLQGGRDHHAPHIHPSGLLSSALYITVPEVAQRQNEGWLEIGRPPQDLDLKMEPLTSVRPREGYLALFPSTLYHATTPFDAKGDRAERVTVAFDVIT